MNTIEGTSFAREFRSGHIHSFCSGPVRRFLADVLLISCVGKAAIEELHGEVLTATRGLAPLRIRRADCPSGFARVQDRKHRELHLALLALGLLDP